MNQTTKIDEGFIEELQPEVVAPPPPSQVEPSAAGASGWLSTLAKPNLAIPFLAAISALMFFANLSFPFYTKGEPREAVTVLAMATGGGVILPMRAGIELPSKPLLMHWIATLLSLLLGGVSEWSIRMPSALFGVAGVLVCYYYVRRLFNARAALIAGLLLATSIQYLQSATTARVDMTLSFFMAVGFFEFLLIGEDLARGRTLLYVAIAMAVLAKGPVGLLLPGAVALVWIAVQWRWRIISDLRLPRGAVIVAVLAGWWYVAASIIGGMAFVQKQLISENLVRFVGGGNFHEGHAHPFYYLEVALAAGFLPWTLLLAVVFWRALRAPRRIEPRLLYLIVWIAVVVGFYSFSHSKRGVYLLSVYPALATLTALYVVDAIDAPATTERLVAFLSSLYGAVLAMAGVAALMALALLWAWPAGFARIFGAFGITYATFLDGLRDNALAQLTLSIAIPTIIVALAIYLLRTTRMLHRTVVSVAVAIALFAVAANRIVVPAIAESLSLKNFATEVMTTVADHPVGYLIDMDYGIAFYSRRTIPIIGFKQADKPEYLVCWENIWQQRPAEFRADYQVIKTSNPTELDGTGRILLLQKVGASAPAKPVAPPDASV